MRGRHGGAELETSMRTTMGRMMAGRTVMGAGAAALLAACGGDDAAEAEIERTRAALEAAAEDVETATVPLGEDAGDGAAAADAYLAENAAREGVRVTDSGLQIETLEPGDGPQPTAADILRINYELRVADGPVLDSSEAAGAPVVLPGYEQLGLPGLLEAVPQMKEGERARITMPPALAFGAQVPPGAPVGANDVIVFDIDLVEVIAADDEERLAALREEETARMEAAQAEAREAFDAMRAENQAASADFLAQKQAEAGVTATDSGLLYEVVEDGGDGPSPEATDRVRVHYRGTLPSGETFDSSYDRGTPTEFALNQVIAGWTEGVALMDVGDTYRFYIPADLAYGERGTPGGPIGPDQALVFDVELLAVLDDAPAEPAAE